MSFYVCLFAVAALTQSGVVPSGVFVCWLNSRATVADLLDSHLGLETHFRSQTHCVQTPLNMQIVASDCAIGEGCSVKLPLRIF